MLYDQEDAGAKEHFETARDLWLGLVEQRTASYTQQLARLLATCPLPSVVDLEAARQYAKEAVDLAPENPEYITTYALACVLAGSTDQAFSLLDRSKQSRGEWIDRDLFVLAMAQQLDGQSDQSRQSLQQAIQWMQKNRPYNSEIRLLREITESHLANDTN